MARPFIEQIKDFEADPAQWELLKSETLPSTNIRNRGGTSTQELFQNRKTGEQIVRHFLKKADGSVFDDAHFREYWK